MDVDVRQLFSLLHEAKLMAFRAKLLRALFASTLLVMAAAGCKDDVNKKIKNGPDPDTNSQLACEPRAVRLE